MKSGAEEAWVVLHTALEGFYRGQVVTRLHLQRGLDREIDIKRLVDLGAMAPVGSDEAKAALAELGPDAVTPAGDPVAAPVPVPTPDITNTTNTKATADTTSSSSGGGSKK